MNATASAALTVSTGSMTCGPTILTPIHGRNSNASVTSHRQEKVMLLRWLATLCTSSVGEQKKEQTLATLQHSESARDGGTPFRTWVPVQVLGQATA